jgi:outer membrane protein OmpA-like peptidoglycan-associated protein
MKRANELFEEKDYVKAISKYQEYLASFEGNPDVWYKIAVCYKEMDQPEKSALYYNRIIKTDEEGNPMVHLALGQVFMMQGKYDEARKHFLRYNELLEFNDQLAMKYIASIENIDKYYNDTSFFSDENLPVNSPAADFGATKLDNSFFFLSTRDRKDDYNEKYSSDLFLSDVNNSATFEVPQKISGPANTRFGEIGYAIVPKTKEIFICRYQPNQQNDYSLGYSLYKAFIGSNKDISRPEAFNINTFKYAIAYPAMSSDGTFMIFASDAPGGYGGWDLYKADYTNNGLENIQNLGDNINSGGDELYPFLLNDSILFFSTDGQGGLGGFDIYSINMTHRNDYSRNLGAPINSQGNDYGIYFDSGLSGYFTSNRPGGKGSDDIYRFTIHKLRLTGEIVDQNNGEDLKNVNISVTRSLGKNELLDLADNGKLVLDAKPGEELTIKVEKKGYESKTFTINTSDYAFLGSPAMSIGKLAVERSVEPTEPVAFTLEPELIEKPDVPEHFFGVQIASSREPIDKAALNKIYSGNVPVYEQKVDRDYFYIVGKYNSYFEAKELYKQLNLDESELVAFINNVPEHVMKAVKEVHVDPAEAKDPEVHAFIDKTSQVDSRIIYYGLDLFRIPDGSDAQLEEVVKMLKERPELFLEIAAHTDKRGGDMYNRALSEERARFLREYFLAQGIPELRIISHGIGKRQLAKYCQQCTEQDHALNRRAELILRVYK